MLLAGQLCAGIVVGLVWLAWAPPTVVYLIPGAGGGLVRIPDESENQIAGDGRYVLLSAAVGLVAGVLAWFVLRTRRGITVMLTVVAGGIASSLLAAAVGHLLAPGQDSGAPRTAIHPRLSLHSPVMLLIQSFLAALVYVVLVGLQNDPSLGRDRAADRSAPELGMSGPAGAGAGAEHGRAGRDGMQLPDERGLAPQDPPGGSQT
jgi:hypothetical protein